jgi:hypothetical protein
MSVDLLKEFGELRKVLLRWDTEKKDVTSVDIKFNYGEKILEAYAKEDGDLEHPEAKLPPRITRRALWCVTRSQDNPLELLSTDMKKWKMSKRKVTLDIGSKR